MRVSLCGLGPLAVPAHFDRPTQTVRAARGSTALLECQAQGDAPLSLHWTREGRRFEELQPKEDATEVGVTSRSASQHLARHMPHLGAARSPKEWRIGASMATP